MHFWYDDIFTSQRFKDKLKYILVVLIINWSKFVLNYTLFDGGGDVGTIIGRVVYFGGLRANLIWGKDMLMVFIMELMRYR